MQNYTTFSIIVPAYNEEKLIGQTLEHLKKLDYPSSSYEVIVVVNGSTDNTYAIANTYSSPSFLIKNIEGKGISLARNTGIRLRNKETKWSILLDADSILGSQFLNELNKYIIAHPKIVYGTATPRPIDGSLLGKIWFAYMSFGVRLLKVFCGIHIIRNDVIDTVSYDETISAGEDIMLARELAHIGRFFCLSTKQYFTSTRRMDKNGYVKMLFVNALLGLLPKKLLAKKHWEPIR